MPRLYTAVFLVFVTCTMQSLLASEDSLEIARSSRAQAMDVTLTDSGTLAGTVVNTRGAPVSGVTVATLGDDNGLPRPPVRTDAEGQFQLANVSPGSTSLRVGKQTFDLRLWNRSLAPPAARSRALFVLGDTIRGQCDDAGCSDCNPCAPAHRGHFGGFFQRVLHNPWIIGGATAAAIAIPIALDNDDDDAS